ncbi:hypothetical protein [Kribbella sp. CA-294648]|uniref:hypothetical protein n=1 Tax=Kribbella sp. CA-294648 TaxID=3239948 RepID=UPI003D901973
MTARGWKHAHLAAAGMATLGLLLVACGNDTKPSGNAAPAGTPTAAATTPAPTTGVPTTPSTSSGPSASGKPSATPSGKPTPTPSITPTPTPTPAPGKPVKLTTAMLLTGAELAKADPKRGWVSTTGSASTPICGRGSTRGANPLGSLSRNFTTDLDASGGQWLTRYSDAKAARAAYDKIIKTVKSCKSAVPAPTHARKLTEDRTLAVGDTTRILRWYDYPLPNDPGSEDGGFPYAITLKGKIVSVLAFREMGPGIKPPTFDRITRAAAAHLT